VKKLLNALYELGKTYTEKEGFQKIDLLLDDLSKVESVIVAEFEKSGDYLNYISTNEKKFNTDDTHLYLYKKGSSRGTDLTPSTKITEVEKTFNLKFLKWLDNNKKNDSIVNELFNEIKSNEDLIKEDIKNVFDNLESKKTSPLLSISIKENDKINIFCADSLENQGSLFSVIHKQLNLTDFAKKLCTDYDIITRIGLHCSPASHKFLKTYPEGTMRISFSPYHSAEDLEKLKDAINF